MVNLFDCPKKTKSSTRTKSLKSSKSSTRTKSLKSSKSKTRTKSLKSSKSKTRTKSLKSSKSRTRTKSLKSSSLKKNTRLGKNEYLKIFVNRMLEASHVIKLYHWKTDSYSTHKATDNLHEKLTDIIDRYVETLLGKTGLKIDMSDYSSLKIKNIKSNQELEEYVKNLIEFLVKGHKKLNLDYDVDLMTLRDEMIIELNQFLYLLRLK